MPGRIEQLWARRLDESRYELCCIPFFTYGIALGDTVLASLTAPYTLGRVVSQSGNRSLRVAIADRARLAQLRFAVDAIFDEYHFEREWYADGYGAANVPAASTAAEPTLELMRQLGSAVTFEIDGGEAPSSTIKFS